MSGRLTYHCSFGEAVMVSTDAPVVHPSTASRPFLLRWVEGLIANEWAAAGLIFLVTRLIALVGMLSGFVGLVAAEPERNKGWLIELALMWDGAWYGGIALDHYAYSPTAEGGTNVAFAPLYPFLIRALSEVLRFSTFGWNWGHPTWGSLVVAGLLISNISFFFALVFLQKLLIPRLGRMGAALVALGLAALPLAFFFSAFYTEGLFLMLVLAALLVARSDWRAKWLCAGLLGMLATLDRFAGALLLPVLLVEYMSQIGWRPRKLRPDVLWTGLVGVGVAIYLGFLWWRFGTPFALNDSMLKGWNHKASFFPETYRQGTVMLVNSLTGAVPPSEDMVLHWGRGSRLFMMLDLATPLVLAVGAFLARKKLLASEWTWLVLGIIYPLSTNITLSVARYMLPLWPGLIWLGTLKRGHRWIGVLVIGASLALLFWCSRIYGRAGWIG